MSKTYIPASLRRLVVERAQNCCEYCLIPQEIVLATHQVDHIIAEKHCGETVSENLALYLVSLDLRFTEGWGTVIFVYNSNSFSRRSVSFLKRRPM
jgi:HNH endonuclease